jgi:hypothetical protein
MELVLAVSVSLMAVLVTFLAIITGRQQKEIESLWKEIRGLNEHLIEEMTANIKVNDGTRAAMEIQAEINEALLNMVKEVKNG